MINKIIYYLGRGKIFVEQAILWWLGELRMLMPHGMQKFLEQRVKWTVIDIVGDDLVLGVYDKEYLEVSRIGLSSNEKKSLGSSTFEAKSILRFHGSSATIKNFELPAIAEKNLFPILRFEIERQTPFLCSQIYFTYQIRERCLDKGRIVVAVAIVRKAMLDNVLQFVQKLGLFPKVVGVFSSENIIPTFKFKPDVKRFGYNRNWRDLLPSFVIAFLVMVAAYSWIIHQDEVLASLNEQLNNAIAADIENKNLRQQLSALDQKLKFLPAEYEKLRVVEMLNELTRLLPDETWVHQLEITGNRVRMTGYSSAAASLITLLDSASFISNTKFSAPITNELQHGTAEKFSLVFEIEGAG